jgi:TPP-dependent 2-oxoacid decarboxylase
MIKGSVNARLATDYFNSISSLKDFGSEETLQLISLLGGGSVGDEFSATFALFINNKLDKIPSPQKIFEFKDSADAIKAIQGSVGDVNTSGYKQNIASVISTRIINFLAKIIEDKEGGFNKKFHVPRVMDIIKSRVLSNDINYNLIKTLNARRQFSQLTEDSEIVKIITR